MAVQFQNYEYSYDRKGKPVFAPSELGRRIGSDIKAQVEAATLFDDFFYHLKPGGHVAALHAHRHHGYFARIDIERFFYSISRSRVQRALADIGIIRARHYAKWSCVKNPYGDPPYSLPYGFIQSPILATLVLMQSGVGASLRAMDPAVCASVYMDDISLSSDDLDRLRVEFEKLQALLADSHFSISAGKVRAPGAAIDVFNCDMVQGTTRVRQDRIDKFYSVPQSPAAGDAFDTYCAKVEAGNV